MNEYDLHTQGASRRPTDAYDGNDPNRNRASVPPQVEAHPCSDGGIVFAHNVVAGGARVPVAADRAGRVYLAGPMTGIPDHNFPAFHAAASLLRAEGLHVENPAEHGVTPSATWADYLAYDLARLGSCSTVALLPGWSKSKGAQLEVSIAHALGMPIRLLDGAEPLVAPGAAAAAALRYTAAMGQAAQRYMDTVDPGRWLSARFRWQGLWNAMLGAASAPGDAGAADHAIQEAIAILESEAASLHESHTSSNAPTDWTGEPEAKAEHDRMLRTAAALRAIPAAGEFYVDHRKLRVALSMCGISAPESNEQLGAEMERHARRVIEFVASRGVPAAGDANAVAGEDAFTEKRARIERDIGAGARRTPHRFSLDAASKARAVPVAAHDDNLKGIVCPACRGTLATHHQGCDHYLAKPAASEAGAVPDIAEGKRRVMLAVDDYERHIREGLPTEAARRSLALRVEAELEIIKDDCTMAAPVEAEAVPSDIQLMALWMDAGGTFHGPNVETGTMAQDKLLPFLRSLMNAAPPAQPEITGDGTGTALLPFHPSELRSAQPVMVAQECKPGGCFAIGCEGGIYCFNADGTKFSNGSEPAAQGDKRKTFMWALDQPDTAIVSVPAATLKRWLVLARTARDYGVSVQYVDRSPTPNGKLWSDVSAEMLAALGRQYGAGGAGGKDDGLEAAAVICDEMAEHWAAYKDTALLNGDVELSNAASGEPRAATLLAKLIRDRKSGLQPAAPQGDA